MASALVVYGSTTGSIKMVAEKIGNVLKQNGMEVTLKNVTGTKISELGDEYELTLLCFSTWGDSEIEFREDFTQLCRQIKEVKLSGKKVALLGCGNSIYPQYLGTVDLLEESMENHGAEIVIESLHIDGNPGDVKEKITEWAEDLAGKA